MLWLKYINSNVLPKRLGRGGDQGAHTHYLGRAWESDDSGYKNNSHNSVTHTDAYICIHMHLHIYIAELLTPSLHALSDVYNDSSGWKNSYLNSLFAGENTEFQRNLSPCPEKKTTINLDCHQLCLLMDPASLFPWENQLLESIKNPNVCTCHTQ